MVGVLVVLIYVFSETDYLLLSGIFRDQRFFSDDGYYLSKQVALFYGLLGFLASLVLGPIGATSCVAWSWMLSLLYVVVCGFVYLFGFQEYDRFLMRCLSVMSLISHILFCNFLFFLLNPVVFGDAGHVRYRVLSFATGFLCGSPLVSFVVLRLSVCASSEFGRKDPANSVFDLGRILLTSFSVALVSTLCLTFQFVYDYFVLSYRNAQMIWTPLFSVPASVLNKSIVLLDIQLVIGWLRNPVLVTLIPYTTALHFQFHRLTFSHKILYSLLILIITLISISWSNNSDHSYGQAQGSRIWLGIMNVMFSDGFLQIQDSKLYTSPISTTSYPNHLSIRLYMGSSTTNPNNTSEAQGCDNLVTNSGIDGGTLTGLLGGIYDNNNTYDLFTDILDYNKNLINSDNTITTHNITNNYIRHYLNFETNVLTIHIPNSTPIPSVIQYPYVDDSWDHAENEDKHLISHVSALVPVEQNNTESSGLEHHMSTLSNNILNLIQNRLSFLSIRYIEYFYHVFPLHINSFNRLFSDVITPQLSRLIFTLNDFTTPMSDSVSLFSDLNNFSSFLSHLKKSYNNLLITLSKYDFAIFIEPYVQILIQAIDHDIDVLTNLISYLNIFIHYYDSLSSNIKTYYKKILCYYIECSSHESYNSLSKKLENFKNILKRIKSQISIFYHYEYRNIYHIKNIKRSIEIIKSELDSLNRCLKLLKSSQPDYINKIIYKLCDIISDKKNYVLKNLEDLSYIKFGPSNLTEVREKLRDIRNDMKYYKDNIDTSMCELKQPSEDILIKIRETIYKHKSSSYNNYRQDLKKLIEDKKIIHRISLYYVESTNVINYFISEVNVMIDFIPNLRQKLLNAESKLDKRQLIKNILEKIKSINIIKTELNILKNILLKLSLEETINKIIFYINSIKHALKSFDFVMERLIYIKNDILNLKVLTLNVSLIKENIQNINYSIEIIKTILTTLNVKGKRSVRELVNSIKLIKCTKCYSNKLNIEPIKGYLNYISDQIQLLKNFELIEKLDSIFIDLRCHVKAKSLILNKGINGLECAIEAVVRNMIRCSLKSLSNHLTNYDNINLSGMNSNMSNEGIYQLYSLISVIEYSVVLNRLHESSIKIHKIIDFSYSCYGCLCITEFEKNNNMDPNNSELGIRNYAFRNKSSEEIYKMRSVSEIMKLIQFGTDGNHICLCMVIKYIMYPQILNLVSVISFELDALSFISRKFEKYGFHTCLNSDYIKVFIIITNLVHELCKFIELKYTAYFIVSEKMHLKCFCTYYQDQNYHLILSIILVISSLIQNIWRMDTHSITVSIGCLSSLLSEFYVIRSAKTKTNDGISGYDPVKYLFFTLKFCKLSTKLQLILSFVSFCYYDPVLTNEIKPYISNLSLTNPSIENVLRHLRDRNIKETGGYFGKLLDKYNSINTSNNLCNQFNNQCCVLSSNVLLYIGVFISCKSKVKLYNQNCDLIKQRLCGFMKCLCDCEKNDCCIKQIIDLIPKICDGKENNCGELLDKCIELCCDTKCCNDKCPCKQLKECCEKSKELCCNSTSGLCKILEEMSKCPCRQKPCNQCKCGCFKIVIEGILIIQEMFRLNVSNISKNIIASCKYMLEIMDKIENTKKGEMILKLIKEITERTVNTITNRVKTLKNNTNTYTHHKNIANIFPRPTTGYAYDTVYEHQISGGSYPIIKGFARGQSTVRNQGGGATGTTRGATRGFGRVVRTKKFKIITTRLLVSVLIVFMFIFLRERFHHTSANVDRLGLTHSRDLGSNGFDNYYGSEYSPHIGDSTDSREVRQPPSPDSPGAGSGNEGTGNPAKSGEVDNYSVARSDNYLVNLFLHKMDHHEPFVNTSGSSRQPGTRQADRHGFTSRLINVRGIRRGIWMLRSQWKKYAEILVYTLVCTFYVNMLVNEIGMQHMDHEMWSFMLSIGVALALLASLVCKYWVHLYDFMHVLEAYGRKLSKVHCVIYPEEIGAIFQSIGERVESKYVMMYSLMRTMGKDVLGFFTLSFSKKDKTTYNEMKRDLYPYKDMSEAIVRMTKSVNEHEENLGRIRDTVVESLGITGETIDVYNVLDFLSYILMCKAFGYLDQYRSYFYGNERYASWRLGRPLNENFFLVTYYRYSAIFEIDKQIQVMKLAGKQTATRNCMLLWQVFGEMEIQLITLKSMTEENLSVPMTDVQKDVLKARFNDYYLLEFLKFQLYIMASVFNVREQVRPRTADIESSFPFADVFEEQALERDRVRELCDKYFESNYKAIMSSMTLPMRTCDVTGHHDEVWRRVKAFAEYWLEFRYDYCKRIRSFGCEKAINFAFDLLISTIEKPGTAWDNVTELLRKVNLENIDYIKQLMEGHEAIVRKYNLKLYTLTLERYRGPISQSYEAEVLHYLNEYTTGTMLNKDKVAYPLGIYMSWYGVPVTEQHLRDMSKYKVLL